MRLNLAQLAVGILSCNEEFPPTPVLQSMCPFHLFYIRLGLTFCGYKKTLSEIQKTAAKLTHLNTSAGAFAAVSVNSVWKISPDRLSVGCLFWKILLYVDSFSTLLFVMLLVCFTPLQTLGKRSRMTITQKNATEANNNKYGIILRNCISLKKYKSICLTLRCSKWLLSCFYGVLERC